MDRTLKMAAIALVLAVCILCTVSSASVDATNETTNEEPTLITATYLGVYKDANQGVYNIPEGDYKVGQNIDMSCTLVFTGDSTLDLNGYTLNGKLNVTLRNTGNLTINDSSTEQDGCLAGYYANNTAIVNEGTLVVEKAILSSDTGIVSNGQSLTVNNVRYWGNGIVINLGIAVIDGGEFAETGEFGIVINDGTQTQGNISVTMNGGTYAGTSAGLQINGGGSADAISTFILNGGTLSSDGSYAIGLAGNGAHDNTKITINDGTIYSENQVALFHPQIGDLTVNGGTLTGYTGIQFCGTGNITITGGNITGNGECKPLTKDSTEDTGTFDDGAALSIISRGEVYQSGGNVTVEITGGNLVSEQSSAVQTYRIALTTENEWVTGDDTKLKSYVASVEINGGTFKSPEGTKPISYDESKESTGVYTISAGKFSGEVDDNLLEEGLELDGNGQVVGKEGEVFEITPSEFLDLGSYSSDGSTVTFDLTRDYTVTNGGRITFASLENQGYSSIVINGNGHTIHGALIFDAQKADEDSASYSVEIYGLTLIGDVFGTGTEWGQPDYNDGFGIVIQNQSPGTNEPRIVDITISGCILKDFSSKGIYLHSVSNVLIEDVTIDNCAFLSRPVYDDNNDLLYYDRGDYSIDIDVTGVDCESIVINDVRFIGENGDLAALKIAQRGGAGDNPDQWGDATIGGVILSNLNFSESMSDVNVMIGSEPNINSEGQEELRDYNSAIPVQLTAMGNTTFSVWGGDRNGDENLILDLTNGTILRTNGQTDADKTSGNIAITLVSGYAIASGVLGPNMSLSADYDTIDVSLLVDRSNGGLDVSEPNPPIIWDDDDDYVPIPPVVVDDSSDDNTVTIVACAAAAVVAALMAVFLIIERRK